MNSPHDFVQRLSSNRVKKLLSAAILGANHSQAGVESSKFLPEGLAAYAELVLKALQAPLAKGSGPLSFALQSGLSANELAGIGQQSLLEATLSAETSDAVMRALAKYAETLQGNSLPPATRLTGWVIRVLVKSVTETRRGLELSSTKRNELSALCRWLAEGRREGTLLDGVIGPLRRPPGSSSE